MRLYRTDYIDDEIEQRKRSWTGSLAAASKDRVALKKEGMREINTVEIDVPTSKTELLDFLNTNAARGPAQ